MRYAIDMTAKGALRLRSEIDYPRSISMLCDIGLPLRLSSARVGMKRSLPCEPSGEAGGE
jgi:hypothetical protein